MVGMMSSNSSIEHLAFAAAKAATRVEYMAYFLDSFRRMEGITEQDLLERLGCERPTLYRLSLAHAPDPQSESFGADIRKVAEWAGISPLELAQLLRRVHAVNRLGEAENTRQEGLLSAARDHESVNAEASTEKTDE